MKFKVGKLSFYSFLISLLFSFLFSIILFPKAGYSQTPAYSASQAQSDSAKFYIEVLQKNPNLNNIRIKLVRYLLANKLYLLAKEQLIYFDQIEKGDSNLTELREIIDHHYKPQQGTIYRDSKLEIEKQNLLNSIKVKMDTDNSARLLSKLNEYKPEDPDIQYFALMVNELITGSITKNENIKPAFSPDPASIPQSSFSYKDINPFDFHKGLRIVPSSYIYQDDLEFQYLVGGVNAEVGLNNILGFGLNIERGHIRIPTKLMRIRRAEVALFIRPVKNLLLSGNIGEDLIADQKSPTADVSVKYEVFPNFRFDLSYTRNDAALVFNSNHLISKRILVNLIKLQAEYNFNKNVKLFGAYEVLRANNAVMTFEFVKRKFPSNYGNNFLFGISKGFGNYFAAGVEYFYSDFENTLPIYYSPQNYSHQSLYCIIYIIKSSRVKINFGGKIGYISNENSALKELSSKMSFSVYSKLIIELDAYYNLTKRYSGNYDSGSLKIAAYWSLIK